MVILISTRAKKGRTASNRKKNKTKFGFLVYVKKSTWNLFHIFISISNASFGSKMTLEMR